MRGPQPGGASAISPWRESSHAPSRCSPPVQCCRVPSLLLTFSAELFNFSGADIVEATVELRGHLHPEEPYARLPAVEIANRDRVRLTHEVTVPAAEYQAWERGMAPWLTIEFLDAAGQSRLGTAETARASVPEEQP